VSGYKAIRGIRELARWSNSITTSQNSVPAGKVIVTDTIVIGLEEKTGKVLIAQQDGDSKLKMRADEIALVFDKTELHALYTAIGRALNLLPRLKIK
jgi:hypothetical protein